MAKAVALALAKAKAMAIAMVMATAMRPTGDPSQQYFKPHEHDKTTSFGMGFSMVENVSSLQGSLDVHISTLIEKYKTC